MSRSEWHLVTIDGHSWLLDEEPQPSHLDWGWALIFMNVGTQTMVPIANVSFIEMTTAASRAEAFAAVRK